MTSDGQDRVRALEERVSALERRLEAVESAVRPAVPTAIQGPPAAATARPAVASGRVDPAERIPPPPPRPSGWVAPEGWTPPRRLSLAELEEQLSGRLLAWVGGVALIIGAVFFLSLAFSRGWIGPEARVLIGFVGASIALGLGAWLFERGLGTPALALVAVGVSVGMLALYAATREYGFIPAELALAGSFLIAMIAAGIALRADAPIVAALGLIGVLAGPPVFDAPANLVTVAFIGAALTGSTAIALFRTWSWLPGIGFLLAGPQLASWAMSEPSLAIAITAAAVFWGLTAAGAGGESLLRDRARLRLGSAALFGLNALFAIGMIVSILDESTALVRSAAVVVLAGAHAALATPPLLRTRARHPFGMLAAGAALGTLAIGIGIELGGIYQPIAWGALAVVVAWFSIAYRHGEARLAATILGLGAILHLVRFEYPLSAFRVRVSAPHDGLPFATPEGIVLALLVAGVLAVTLLGARALRADSTAVRGGGQAPTPGLVIAVGALVSVGLVAYAAPFELPAVGVVLAWAALAAVAVWLAHVRREDTVATTTLESGAAVLVGVGLLAAVALVAPLGRLAVDAGRGAAIVPLFNEASVLLAGLAVPLVLAAWLARRPEIRTIGATGAGGLLVYLGSIAIVDLFQTRTAEFAVTEEVATQAQVALSISWVVVGAVAFGIGLVRSILDARFFGLALLGLATLKVFAFDLAELDVAYRVLSFIGLGLVLLASSFVAVRIRSPDKPPNGVRASDPGRR